MQVKGLGRGGSVIDVGGGGGTMASTQPIPAAGPSLMDVHEEDGGQAEPQEESQDCVAASVLARLRIRQGLPTWATRTLLALRRHVLERPPLESE